MTTPISSLKLKLLSPWLTIGTGIMFLLLALMCHLHGEPFGVAVAFVGMLYWAGGARDTQKTMEIAERAAKSLSDICYLVMDANPASVAPESLADGATPRHGAKHIARLERRAAALWARMYSSPNQADFSDEKAELKSIMWVIKELDRLAARERNG